MSERMRDDELEATLKDIGAHLAYPEPTRLRDAVLARIRAPRRPVAWYRRLAPALATAALLALVLILASPAVRTAAGEFFHLRGIDIFNVPSTPSALPSAPIVVPGDRVTLAEARRRAGFAIRVPAAGLGEPDAVFVDTSSGNDRITLEYGPRPGMPPTQVPGVSALVVEFRGAIEPNLFAKTAGPETRVEQVAVNGGPGLWLEGAPHLFFYRDASGAILPETLRLAGNTLVWEQDGVTLRLEAQVTRARALEIAASLR